MIEPSAVAIPSLCLDASATPYFDSDHNTWNVFSYRDVSRVLLNYADFSMEYGDPDVHPTYGAMWFRDPPRHTDLKVLVDETFHVRAIRQLSGVVTRIVDDLLDEVIPRGSADILVDLAQPLPAVVISELLGLNADAGQRFLGWLQDEHRLLTLGDFSGSPEMLEALTALLQPRPGTNQPGLIHDLLNARRTGYRIAGDPLSERDLVGYVYMLLSASFGATTAAIGNYLVTVLERGLWSQLQADPALIPLAIEESLRWDTPMPALRTQAVNDLTFGEHIISAGQFVTAWMSAANRDPTEFPAADDFQIDRRPNRHLSFGRGVHYCLGAELGRLEMRILTERLLQRLPTISLDATVPVARHFGLLYGVEQAVLTFKAGYSPSLPPV